MTRERPIASVIVTAEANGAARSIPGAGIGATIRAGDASARYGDPAAPAIAIIEAIDAADRRPEFGDQPRFSATLGESCAESRDCSARFRITAILIDPDVESASVPWGAKTELYVNGPSRPPSAPPDARLAAKSDEPTSRPSSDLTLSALPIETVRLDVDHPLASRFIALDQPPGVPGVTAGSTWLAFLTTAEPGKVHESREALVTLSVPGERGSMTEGVLGRLPFYPTPCPGSSGCTTSLRLDLANPSGTAETARAIDWSISVVAFASDGSEAPGHAGLRATGTSEIGPDSGRLAASESGTFDVQRGVDGSRVATVVLNASEVAQGSGRIHGHLQLRYTVDSGPTIGVGDIAVGIGAYGGSLRDRQATDRISAGQTSHLVTGLLAADCESRSRCTFQVPFHAEAADAGTPVRLDWRVTATWFADVDERVPEGLRLELGSAEPSSRP